MHKQYHTSTNQEGLLVYTVGSRGAVVSFRSERFAGSHRFTPPAHVRRQSLPVWPPTLSQDPLEAILVISGCSFLNLFERSWKI